MINYKIPEAWIDRIFDRFSNIYGDQFSSRFSTPERLAIEKKTWQSGLFGATADEIKNVLDLCHKGFIAEPPHVLEFYHYCKGNILPRPVVTKFTRTESEQAVGEEYLKKIKDKLHGKRID